MKKPITVFFIIALGLLSLNLTEVKSDLSKDDLAKRDALAQEHIAKDIDFLRQHIEKLKQSPDKNVHEGIWTRVYTSKSGGYKGCYFATDDQNQIRIFLPDVPESACL